MKLIMNILINFFATLYDLVIDFFATLYDLVYNFIKFLVDYLKWITNMKSAKPNKFSKPVEEPSQARKQSHFIEERQKQIN